MTPEQVRQITALQIQVANLTEDLRRTSERLERTDQRLDMIYDLLNQGRGMKTLIVFVLSVFGIGGVIALLQAIQPFIKGH